MIPTSSTTYLIMTLEERGILTRMPKGVGPVKENYENQVGIHRVINMRFKVERSAY